MGPARAGRSGGRGRPSGFSLEVVTVHETFRLGRIAGIRIGANWTVLVVAFLIAWALATELLPSAAPGRPAVEYWAMGTVAAFLFFLSLLAHELAHAIQARHEGMEVDGITLWLLGGVAQLRGEARSPGAEARVAGVGPLVSLGLGLLFGLVALGALVATLPLLLVSGLAWLGGINLVLGLFNLLPAAPLDGGRLLRAVIWRWRGNALQATVVATAFGRALGMGMIGFGMIELVAGQDTGGIWTMVLGFFLVNAATAESGQATVMHALRDVPVRAAMDAGLLRVPGGLRLDTFVSQVALAQRASAYLVVGPGGDLIGLVVLAQIGRIPASERRERRIEDVARPIAAMPSAGPDELVVTVLERQVAGSPGVLVFDQGLPVGFLGPREIADAIERARLVGRGGPQAGGADRRAGATRPS
jgi:Zn-dependent protease